MSKENNPILFNASSIPESRVLSEVEIKLLRQIEQYPGIRYRELLKLSGLANGVLSYRLNALKNVNVIIIERHPGQTRLYPANISAIESKILAHLRNKPERELIILLLKRDVCTFNELIFETGKAASTISSHLKRLREAGIISVTYGHYYNLYSLLHREQITEVLSKYKKSLMDNLVENYTEMIAEI
jgi:predicted transcriptional regulator